MQHRNTDESHLPLEEITVPTCNITTHTELPMSQDTFVPFLNSSYEVGQSSNASNNPNIEILTNVAITSNASLFGPISFNCFSPLMLRPNPYLELALSSFAATPVYQSSPIMPTNTVSSGYNISSSIPFRLELESAIEAVTERSLPASRNCQKD